MTAGEIEQLQRRLVDTMRGNGSLPTGQIERAFLHVPRHRFLPDVPLEKVYSDAAIAVKRSETGRWTSSSSQPSMMAIMLEQLDLQPGHRVLEIGTGSGYNAAMIADIVGPQGKVVTVDIQPDLVEAARACLDDLGFDWVKTIAADGGFGCPEEAPFDRIILTTAADRITRAWREQLAPDGILVLPLDLYGSQKSIAFSRQGSALVSGSIEDCGFMRLQGAFTFSEPTRTPVGPDPLLFLTSDVERPVEAARLWDWLYREEQLLPTGVVARFEQIWSGLFLWLNLHQPGVLVDLSAIDERAEQNPLPPLLLFGNGGEWRTALTVALIEDEGAAALSRPPHQDAPFTRFNSEIPGDRRSREPFELYIRQFGPDDHPARLLLSLVKAWDAAGKPTSARLHLRAFPAGEEDRPAEGGFLLTQPDTHFIVWFE